MYCNSLTRQRGRRSAFTLFEILIVIALIAGLAGLAVVNVGKLFASGQEDITRTWVTQGIKTSLMTYKIHTGDFPSTEEGLAALVAAPANVATQWRGPYAEFPSGAKSFVDPWKSPYQYRYPGTHNPNGYDVWSLGPDKKDGTADDIGNW